VTRDAARQPRGDTTPGVRAAWLAHALSTSSWAVSGLTGSLCRESHTPVLERWMVATPRRTERRRTGRGCFMSTTSMQHRNAGYAVRSGRRWILVTAALLAISGVVFIWLVTGQQSGSTTSHTPSSSVSLQNGPNETSRG